MQLHKRIAGVPDVVEELLRQYRELVSYGCRCIALFERDELVGRKHSLRLTSDRHQLC
jgi:hypothetical protein